LKLAWLAEARTIGQKFLRMGVNGILNINQSFLKEQYKWPLKEIQELEEVKQNAVKLQKLLMEVEEAHDKIKCLGIELRAGNKKLVKTILLHCNHYQTVLDTG
jgi:hypothetical protein